MTTINEELQQLWEHNKAFFSVVPRRVQVQKTGGWYRARYEGEANSCFGTTATEAKSKLKLWEKP